MFAAHAMLLTGVGLPPPTVTGITPTSFYTSRWVGFTITGTNFVPGATTVSAAIGAGNVANVIVNATGTSLYVEIYAPSAGSSVVTVTTPFGSASTGAISASVEPPPMTVTSAYRGNEFNNVFVSSSSNVMIIGSGFTSSTMGYIYGHGYKPVSFFSSTQFRIQTGIVAAGQFALYDPNTGSGTPAISYS
jgi:hypothetical protein